MWKVDLEFVERALCEALDSCAEFAFSLCSLSQHVADSNFRDAEPEACGMRKLQWNGEAALHLVQLNRCDQVLMFRTRWLAAR
jgi:hypothetical protein